MTAPVDICNIALSRIGGESITSIDEGTRQARLCQIHYDPSLNAELRGHPWNFATKRVSLALNVAVPVYEYSNQFSLPDDWLRVIRINEDEVCNDYRVEGRKLLTNNTVVYLEYIAKVTDPNQMDAQFIDVFAQRLAAEVAYPLTKNQTITDGAWKVYNQKIRLARGMDAQEGTPRNIEADLWLGSRF